MTLTERVAELENDLQKSEEVRAIQHDTLTIQLESIKLIVARLVRLEEEATERGWILVREQKRTLS